MLSDWILPFSFGVAVGLVVAVGYSSRDLKRQGKGDRNSLQSASNSRKKKTGRVDTPQVERKPPEATGSCEGTERSGQADSCRNRKPRQHFQRGALNDSASQETHTTNFDRDVLCEDALVWLEGLTAGLPSGSSVLTGIPDIHEVDAEGRMGLEGYVQWFQLAVKLILQKLPADGRAIFMQTDVKVAQHSAQGRKSGDGCYWQWLDKSYLVILAGSMVPGVRLLWHKIIFSGTMSAGGRNGSTAGYTHYLCFTKGALPEALDGCTFPDVLRKGLATWKSGSGVQSVELACAYLKARGCSMVVDPFCGEGAVLAVGNFFGMAALGVELNKKRAKFARSLDGKVLVEADRAERKRVDVGQGDSYNSSKSKASNEFTDSDIETFDGTCELHLNLDDAGSTICYLPFFGLENHGDAVDCAECPSSLFSELENILFEVTMQVPTPPKDTSGSNGRAQYYGVSPHLRANPRWCNAARKLEGPQLACAMRIKAAVERAVAKLLLHDIDLRGEFAATSSFNSFLINRYADGSSQVAWHSDDEKCYGPSSSVLIASVSLGADRYFDIRRKPRKGDTDLRAQQRKRFLLKSGSLLVMAGPMQAAWQHAILADDTCTEPRLNLTFRNIIGDRRRGETHA